MNGLTIDFEEVKSLAGGRWAEILPQITSLPPSVLTKGSSDHPCPVCGGKSVIWPAQDAQQTGRIACRNCTGDKPTSDGIKTIAAFNNISQTEAARAVAAYLRLDTSKPRSTAQQVDLIDAVCRAKRMPRAAFEQFGITVAKRGRKDVVRVVVYDSGGSVHSHFDLSPEGKGLFKGGKGSSGMFFPGRLPAAGETWLLVEGVKDAAALIGLGFDAAGLPGSEMPAAFARLFRDCDVVIVHDLDEAGKAGSQATGGRLAGIARSVRIARLPGEVKQKGGDDVRDVLARDGGEEMLRQSIEDAQPWEPSKGTSGEDDSRPEVMLTLRHSQVADKVIGCLAALGWDSPWLPAKVRESRKVYRRAGVLVDVIPSGDALRIRELPTAQLALRIGDACRLFREKETPEGDVVKIEEHVPSRLVDGIATHGHFDGIRELNGIVYAPTIRPDGTILQAEGHDEATGLLYRPAEAFPPIPSNPSREDAQQAAEALLEVIVDFPFVDDVDRSAWIALLLTQIGRAAVDGCCPLFAITATTRGSGKSLLADAASIVAYGRHAARKTYPRDDDETRKVVTAVAIEAIPSVLLDNIDRRLGGASLDAAITATTWNDRVLGRSQSTGELPLRTVWAATGNNLSLGSDLARRVLPIRLASQLENPEERSDFHHDDLLGWVRWNRPRLAVAALTMLRAYFAAGCPEQTGGAWGSFESWSRVIRGAIVWAGLPDPMVTRESAKAEDTSAAIVAGLIGGLIEIDDRGHGLTARQIADKLNSDGNRDRYNTMREVAVEVAGGKSGMIDPHRLGCTLRKYLGRVVDGFAIEKRSLRARGVAWFAQRIGDDAGDGGDTAFLDPHHHHHHQKPSNLRGETVVGDDGDTTFLIHTREGKSNTHEIASKCMRTGTRTYGWIGKQASPSSPPREEVAKSQGNTHVLGGDIGGDAARNEASPLQAPSPPCEHEYTDSREGDRIKTVCKKCGKFYGSRPAHASR